MRDNTDGKVFIVREDAGFWYLTTGTRNPLPFDIPEVSDFGADGEAGVIRRLERGEATWVCVKPVKEHANGELEPRRIRRWVRAHFEFVETIRQCDMYKRRTLTVLLEQRFAPLIADGSVTVTFRRWRRRQAVAGRRYRTPGGIIEVDDIRVVDPATISDARRTPVRVSARPRPCATTCAATRRHPSTASRSMPSPSPTRAPSSRRTTH